MFSINEGHLAAIAARDGLSKEQQNLFELLAAGATWTEVVEKLGGGLLPQFQAYDEVVSGLSSESIIDVGDGLLEALVRREDLDWVEKDLLEHLVLNGTWNDAGVKAQRNGKSFYTVFDVYDRLVLREQEAVIS